MINISIQEKIEIINKKINGYTKDHETMLLYLNDQNFIDEMGPEYMEKYATLINDIENIIVVLNEKRAMLT